MVLTATACMRFPLSVIVLCQPYRTELPSLATWRNETPAYPNFRSVPPCLGPALRKSHPRQPLRRRNKSKVAKSNERGVNVLTCDRTITTKIKGDAAFTT
jgi:hypothetical protein